MPNVVRLPRAGANGIPSGRGKQSEQKPEEQVVAFTSRNGGRLTCVSHGDEGHSSITGGMEQLLFVLNVLPYHFTSVRNCELPFPMLLSSSFSERESFRNISLTSLSRILINFVCPHQRWENTTAILMGKVCTLGLEFGIDCFLLPGLSLSSNYHFSLEMGASWLQNKAVLSRYAHVQRHHPCAASSFVSKTRDRG